MESFLYSIGGFVVAIGILVTVHELGHFWVARLLGVRVLRFSVGFGKPVYVHRGRRDGTEYVLSAVPLGGYVKMLDEAEGEVAAADLPRAFNRQPLWRRAAIVLAGPGFNFLFAVVAYFGVYLAGVEGVRPVVGQVVEGSIAADAGFRQGDEVVSVDGRPNRTWNEHRLLVFDRALAGAVVPFEVRSADGTLRRIEVDFSRVPLEALDSGVLERGIGLYGYVPPMPPEVGGVVDGSPAMAAGLRPGDRIVAIAGQAVSAWADVVRAVADNPGRPLAVAVERDGQRLEVGLIPQAEEVDGRRIGRIGIMAPAVEWPDDMIVTVQYGVLDAARLSIGSTWTMSALTVDMLVRMLRLEVSASNISGPLTIAQYAGSSARVGVEQFALFLAVVSISLGILNLLPIPVLDGGHLLWQAVEAVKGGPLSKQTLLRGQQIGIVLLAGLMGLAFYNDIVRLLQ